MPRLSPEEAAALGLPPKPTTPDRKRLSAEEAASLGLPSDPTVSKTAALGRGAAQGATFGLADETAGIRAATGGLPEFVRSGLSALPGVGGLVGQPEEAKIAGGSSFLERYRAARDLERKANAAAKAARPGMYTVGELGGGIIPALIPAGGIAKGATLGAKLLRGLKTGAATGTAYGAGMSEAETPMEFASDITGGAALGGIGGAAVPVVGAAVKRLASPVSNWLQRRAVESGRKALSGIGTPLAARKEIPEAVVNQALDTGAIKPLGTVTGAAGRLREQADMLGEVYGKLVDDLAAAGVEGPNAELMAQAAVKKATAAGKVLARAEKGEWEQLSQELREAVDPTPFASKRLGLQQVQEIKHNLQEASKREYDKIARQTTMKGEAMKKSAAYVREAMEQAIEEQAEKAPKEAAAFMPVKERLSNTLAALSVAGEGASRAARKAPPSLLPHVMVAGVTGSPGLGLLTLLSRLADRRVASTLATTSRAGSKALGALSKTNLSPAQQAETQRLAAFIAALRSPGTSPAMAMADEENP